MMKSVKLGRPSGIRDGHGVGSSRKKVQIGLYPDDISKLIKLEEKYNVSRSEIVRMALIKMK